MDSITQIVLGASVGEVVLGKKIGNRAMIWGAVAGTIPDLDIIGNLFMSELDALAFHRGISHSIFFAITFSFLIAYVVNRLYRSGLYQKPAFKWIIGSTLSLFMLYVLYFIGSVFLEAYGIKGLLGLIPFLLLFGWTSWSLYTRYIKVHLDEVNISYREWYTLFFWSIFTHPLLDAFTSYGTQLFAPFSNYRVAFNTISVADPLYTIPFLVMLIAASRMYKSAPKRRIYNYLGLGISSCYLLLTVFNKIHIDGVMKDTLKQEGISYERFSTSPSILNNVLWSGIAQNGDTYYQGTFSIFDQEKKFKLQPIPQQTELINHELQDETIQCLRWFSKDYYGFIRLEDGKIQLNDLRYGKFNSESNDQNAYIFRFILEQKNGGWQLVKSLAGPSNEDRRNILKNLWERITSG